MMSAQEALAIEQVKTLRPGTVLRLDETPSRKIRLDDTGLDTTELLISLARQAVKAVEADHAADWRRFLAHAPVAPR